MPHSDFDPGRAAADPGGLRLREHPRELRHSPRSATRYFALTERNLFHYNSPQDLAEKMDWWLEHPQERKACSERYLGYAEQFAFDRCMDRMEQMIIEAGEKHREK